MERDNCSYDKGLYKIISTHTLTWSVTESSSANYPQAYISTHTLTWSVTYKLCKERDIDVISTHTLTWSVTLIGLVIKD